MNSSRTFLMAVALFVVISCSKSPTDPDTIFKVKYSIISAGDVHMDTIQYKNLHGETITIKKENNLNYWFTSSNGYDAGLFMSGFINDGTVEFTLQIMNDNMVAFADSSYQYCSDSMKPLSFRYGVSKMFIVAR
ncbi:MAG: hypothetical protein A2W85_16020 [Bacteroidetes bacterium GWF2_41_31]|nr:MAG: hypothetical protein A2W85_16020 [Bacteroidetes bacterium GWF2_41_31]